MTESTHGAHDESGMLSRWVRVVLARRRMTLAVVMLLTALAMVPLARLRVNNSVEYFVGDAGGSVQAYDDFRGTFGRDNWVIVAVETPGVFGVDVLEKLRRLHEELERAVPHVRRVVSVVNARSVQSDADSIRVDPVLDAGPVTVDGAARSRARTLGNPLYPGMLVSHDERLATILIEPHVHSALSDAGKGEPRFITDAELGELVTGVREVLARHDAPGFTALVSGSPEVWYRLNRAVESDTALFFSLTLLVVVLVAAATFRSVRVTVIVAVVAVLPLLAAFGLMALLNIPMSATTQVLPSLLLTIAVCGAVHVVSGVRVRVARGLDPQEAIARAVQHSGGAVMTANATSAVGLASFVVSGVPPVAHLGIVGAIGMLCITVYLLTLLPALLPLDAARWRRIAGRLVALEGWQVPRVYRRGRMLSVAYGLFAVVTLLGAARVRFSQNHILWFPWNDPARRAVRELDGRLDGVVTIEAVVDSGTDGGAEDPDFLRRVDRLAHQARTIGPAWVPVRKTMAVTDLLREVRGALDGRPAPADWSPATREEAAQSMLLLEMLSRPDLDALVDPAHRRTRLTLSVPWAESSRYEGLSEALVQRGEAAVAPATLRVTGETRLLAMMFETLGASMINSYALELSVVALMLVFSLRSWRLALASITTNLVPMLAMLGVIGWFGWPLDLSSLMAGAIAIGLSIDDTIHFMHSVRGELRHGVALPDAIERTLDDTGPGMVQAAVILACGFAAFLLAYMTFVKIYGALLLVAIGTALVANLTLAPALLMRFFARQPARAQG